MAVAKPAVNGDFNRQPGPPFSDYTVLPEIEPTVLLSRNSMLNVRSTSAPQPNSMGETD
ncbi:hypothetical protein BH11PSE13_BH11PSE13_30240 [soil metagenome]